MNSKEKVNTVGTNTYWKKNKQTVYEFCRRDKRNKTFNEKYISIALKSIKEKNIKPWIQKNKGNVKSIKKNRRKYIVWNIILKRKVSKAGEKKWEQRKS